MHMIIRAIVYAKNKNEALTKASNIFDSLTENGNPFDYYTLFNDFSAQCSGPARWGKLAPVSKASSSAGKKLINQGMEANKREFKQAIEYVRKGLEQYTDDQLFKDNVQIGDYKGMFKYFCSKMGRSEGPDVYLYDNDGEGITTESHLKDVLGKWNNANEYKNLDIFVVPADVHY